MQIREQSTTPPQPRPRARRRMLSRSWTAPGSPSECSTRSARRREPSAPAVSVSRPGGWKFRWSDLRGKIISELAKDFSRRPLEDVASLIADA